MKLLVIGCGGVAQVAIRKCCQAGIYDEILIASRTKSRCDALIEKIKDGTKSILSSAKVDADSVPELKKLISAFKPAVVLNVALPYQDLTIMQACLECGAHYVDTANYECEDTNDPAWRAVY